MHPPAEHAAIQVATWCPALANLRSCRRFSLHIAPSSLPASQLTETTGLRLHLAGQGSRCIVDVRRRWFCLSSLLPTRPPSRRYTLQALANASACRSVRILLYSVPTMRQMGVGAALMLEHPATPGWRGAAKDFLRLLSGACARCWGVPTVWPSAFETALPTV